MSEPDPKIAELVELKRKYRQDCATLETEAKERMAHELAEKRKALAESFAGDLAKALAERLKPLLMEVLTEE